MRDVARTPLAEAEVVASHDAHGPEPLYEHVGDELLRIHRRQFGPEAKDEHRVGTGMGEQPLTLVEGRETEGRHLWLEMAHWVRVESGDDHRPPKVEAERNRPADHRLVAEMEAVEIAERDDRAAKLFRDRLVVVQPLHWRRSIGASRPPQFGAGNVGFPLSGPTHAFPRAWASLPNPRVRVSGHTRVEE